MQNPGIKQAMKKTSFLRHRLFLGGRSVAGYTRLFIAGLFATLLIHTAQAKLPDYDALDEILARNVHNGFIDYDGIAAEPELRTFVEQLGTTRPTDLTTAASRLAFYINAYNVLAIQSILDGRSPSSRGERHKFFQRQKFNVLGQMMSLETLEHDRIIASGDRRIHFAIVCASMSCPRLSNRAYRPESLDVQLHESAKRFINDLTRNQFDADRRIIYLSKIFKWYEDDFIAAGSSLQRYLARFVSDAQVQDALRNNEFRIRFIDYDWDLNGRYSGKN